MTTPPRRKPRTGENRLDPDDPRSRPSSPERSGRQSLIEHLEERLRCADDARVRAAIRSIVESPILEEFRARVAAYDRDHPEARRGEGPVAIPQREIRDRIGEIPVGVLTRRARAALERPTGAEFTPSRIVRLSAETALKQLARHPDITAEHYGRLPDLLEHGEIVPSRDRNFLAFFGELNGLDYLAVVKQSSNNEIFLTSFYRIHRADIPRAKQRAAKARRLITR